MSPGGRRCSVLGKLWPVHLVLGRFVPKVSFGLNQVRSMRKLDDDFTEPPRFFWDNRCYAPLNQSDYY